jgi:hypothetical protein
MNVEVYTPDTVFISGSGNNSNNLGPTSNTYSSYGGGGAFSAYSKFRTDILNCFSNSFIVSANYFLISDLNCLFVFNSFSSNAYKLTGNNSNIYYYF